VIWVAALIFMPMALPALLARLAGGYPARHGTEYAALAPLAVVPAVVAVIIAALTVWWLAVLLAIPTALLVGWQLPPLRQVRFGRAARSPEATALRLRLFTLNAQRGGADPAVILQIMREHDVDVLAVQELTPGMVDRLTAAGLPQVLPFSHVDARPRSRGTGLWARWPLTTLPPVPGLASATPQARIDPPGGFAVGLTVVHPVSPIAGRSVTWQRELEIIREALAAVDAPHVVAGDFNASRDHKLFREILAAGFLDCADVSQTRSWPGFTWPARQVMRLDHVLVSRPATVPMARPVRVPGTDHRGVLVEIVFSRAS
jgi:endonuclease/exonuclease/phosphatase (EEP) superfamily protein YafD